MNNVAGSLAPPDVYLNRVVTKTPPHDIHRKFLSVVPSLIGEDRSRRMFSKLAAKAQIEHRYSVLEPSTNPDEIDNEGFYLPGRFASTARRMDKYEQASVPLALEAVEELLKGVDRERVTHLIVTSCTGFFAPGLDLILQRRLGLRSDLERSIIGFMGCYAAFNGLKSAWHIVRSRPDAVVMMLNLELCTIHLQENSSLEDLLGFMQFADGCAASLISANPNGLRMDGFRCEVLSEREELIQWHIRDTGFEMFLSPSVPLELGRALPKIFARLMTEEEESSNRFWAVHPGGRAILDVVQEKLGLDEDAIGPSRRVLRDFGNMSSATIMFILRNLMASRGEGPGMAMAFGPGLTVETMRFFKET